MALSVKVTGSTTKLSGSQNAYIVLFDSANNLFISDAVGNTIDEMSTTLYAFNEGKTGDIWALNGDASEGYAGAGWYTAAAAPEPTSGLLLLLGMAGLALRRKQA